MGEDERLGAFHSSTMEYGKHVLTPIHHVEIRQAKDPTQGPAYNNGLLPLLQPGSLFCLVL